MSATLARAVTSFYSSKKAQKITEYRDTAPLSLVLTLFALEFVFREGSQSVLGPRRFTNAAAPGTCDACNSFRDVVLQT